MPPREPPQSAEPDLDALTQVVDRLSGFNDHLSVEWIDGYLSAVLAGPRTVLPSEWLPKMLGDAFDRAFADPPDVQQAMGALTARWNVIAMQLEPQALLDEPDALRLAPLMTDLGEELRQELRDKGVKEDEIAALPQTGAEWACGFLQALDDFPDDWPEPDIATPEGATLDNLLMRVIALQLEEKDLQEHLVETYPDEPLDRDDLIDEACLAVQDLRVYWLDHAPKPPTRRVAEKTGRNDPCPCGSGRKYKKCHGAQ